MQRTLHTLAGSSRGGACILIAAGLLLAGCSHGRDSEPVPTASAGVAASTDPGIPAALAGADTVRVDTIAPGVRHLYAWDARGPWGIHLLEIDAARCEPVYAARKAGPPQSERARTGALAGDALAGINADFFMLPGGTTVGAHVEDGHVVAGPGTRPVLALVDGQWWIGRAALHGHVARRGGEVLVPIVQVNRTHPGDTAGAVLFTHWYGDETPVDSATTGPVVAVTVRRLKGAEPGRGGAGRVGGDSALGLVSAVDTLGGPVALTPGTVVLRGRRTAAAKLRRLAVGDTVVWIARVVPADGAGRTASSAGAEGAWSKGAAEQPRGSTYGSGRSTGAATEAVGGYPILLRNGEIAPEMDEGVSPAFGERRHPRTAVGFADDGRRMLWFVVDGRQEGYSAGMSLREVATLLRDLGAEQALNLDGGGSSALVVRGRVANRPSDPTGERPVGNALLLAGCQADG